MTDFCQWVNFRLSKVNKVRECLEIKVPQFYNAPSRIIMGMISSSTYLHGVTSQPVSQCLLVLPVTLLQ